MAITTATRKVTDSRRSTPNSQRPENRATRWGWLVVATVATLAVLGLLLDLRAVAPTSAHQQSRSYRIGDDVPTSFGIVAVEFVRGVDGVSHRALAGASHGVSGYVHAGQQQIQVAVALTNTGKVPLSYTVRQFRLRITARKKTTVLHATSGDLPDGRVLPAAGIEGHLDFTVPAVTAAMSLTFDDPGRATPITINLGTVKSAVTGTEHHHG